MALGVGLGAWLPAGAAAASAEPLRLSLTEAVESALARNERIVLSRVALDSAEAAVEGARGPYDTRIDADAGWHRFTEPVNSAFAGAPGDALAPTVEEWYGNALVSRLLPTGGSVAVRAASGR